MSGGDIISFAVLAFAAVVTILVIMRPLTDKGPGGDIC